MRGGARSRFVVGLVVAVAALLFVPSAASAKKANFSFGLKGSSGMRVLFSASTKGEAAVLVARGKGSSFQAATYETDSARVTPTRIVAGFGSFGEIDVRYRDKPGTPKCAIPAITGTVRGTIRFRGEGGYTVASASRLEATRSPYGCKGGFNRSSGLKRPPVDEAFLLSCRPDEGLRYTAIRTAGVTFHNATVFEQTKRLQIQRTTQYEGERASFNYSGSPAFTATATPEGYFSGSADYSDKALSGDLSATFLGREDRVPLTPAKAGLFVDDEGSFPSVCQRLSR